MIEDEEIRLLFQAESEERIKHLYEGIKALEGNLQDLTLIDELFRDAHTIKGAARMLDLQNIERIVHIMEDQFSSAKKGETVLDLEKLQVFYEAVDKVAELVQEAVSGKTANVDVEPIIAKLSTPLAKKPPTAAVEAPIAPTPAAPIPPPAPPPPPKEAFEPEKITTVRVNYQTVDELSNQAAELIVIKNRMNHLSENIAEIAYFWEESNNAILKACRGQEASFELEKKYLKKMSSMVTEASAYSYSEIHKLEMTANALVEKIKLLSLVPISKLFDYFPRMVREMARTCQKEIELNMVGGQVGVDKRIVEQLKDPLMHLIRNAIDHGIEPQETRVAQGKPAKGKITLAAQNTANHIIFEVIDDGRGLDEERIKQKALEKKLRREDDFATMSSQEIFSLVFLPGFSTAKEVTDFSGRGVGLDVVREAVEKLNGSITVDSEAGKGTLFRIELPMSVITTHILLVKVGESSYAIPIDIVDNCALINRVDLSTINEQQVVLLNGTPISVLFLRDLLEIKEPEGQDSKKIGPSLPCLFIKVGGEIFGLLVDEILGEQKVVVSPPSPLLRGALYFRGTTILTTGKVCVLLNPVDIAKNLRKYTKQSSIESLITSKEGEKPKKRILYVEDSLTMQSHIKHLLENANYEVLIGCNGEEGLGLLENHEFDAVVSDIEMPKMDGLSMVTQMRKKKAWRRLPVIFLSSASSEENLKKADELNASAFLIKSHFTHDELIKTLQKLLV